MFCRELHDLFAVHKKLRVAWEHGQGVGALLDHRLKSTVYVRGISHFQRVEYEAQGASRRLRLFEIESASWKIRTQEQGHPRELGKSLLRISNLFPLSSGEYPVNPVMFPPGRAEAGDKSGPNRVRSGRHDDRNCLCRLPDSVDHRIGKCYDDIDFQTNQFGSKDRKLFSLALTEP
jgi:hypothetical protein